MLSEGSDAATRGDPWGWIDERVLRVDHPILGPAVGLLFVVLCLVSGAVATTTFAALVGQSTQGMVTVTHRACHTTPRGESCDVKGRFVSDDGQLTLVDVTLPNGFHEGEIARVSLTKSIFGDYIASQSLLADLLLQGSIFVVSLAMAAAWLYSMWRRFVRKRR
jgi:hypothetical protein